MKTLKIGIAPLDAIKARTINIAKGKYKSKASEPKIWFSSIESFAKLLSEKNRNLLSIIAKTKPNSLQELAEQTGRAKSNLSRTLKMMENYGLVKFEKLPSRKLAPRVTCSELSLDLSIF